MRFSGRKALAVVLVVAALAGGLALIWPFTPWNGRAAEKSLKLDDIPFDGKRAYGYLKQMCDIGPRPSCSPGMEKQQKLLHDHFKKAGAEVSWQTFAHARYPGKSFANLIIRWHPRSTQRILLCAHYDTRPYPDQDKKNPRGTFIGANDGGSGVAVLMELAHDLPNLKLNYGVDFVLFDAEEYMFKEDSELYFLGSTWFATDYARTAKQRKFSYKWGVLMDMVGDADLQIFKEKNSLARPSTRSLVRSIWATADRLGVREFHSRAGYSIRDDHLPLNNIAGIPSCDIIDFDYPHWHTEGDTADKCSALSLAKVGWVVKEWLKSAR